MLLEKTMDCHFDEPSSRCKGKTKAKRTVAYLSIDEWTIKKQMYRPGNERKCQIVQKFVCHHERERETVCECAR